MSLCIILGAGNHARETFWHANQIHERYCSRAYSRFVFVDDVTDTTEVVLDGRRWPVEKHWEFSKYAEGSGPLGFIVGFAEPKGKMNLVKKALAAGLTPLPSVVHRSALIQDPSCEIGVGGLIGPGCILTTNVRLGDFVTLNLNVSVSHDCHLMDYANCAPRVALAGNVVLNQGVSLGIGSVVREKVHIAPFVSSGAQACIVKSITTEGITVVGVPAKPLVRAMGGK